MVTGSVHSLTPDLMLAMQQYSRQLQKSASVEEDPATAPPNQNPPAGQPADLTGPIDNLEKALQENRNTARQAALLVNQANHAKDIVETYMVASSNAKHAYDSDSYATSGAQVYQEIKEYYNRQDMLDAFEKAREPDDLWSYDYEEIRIEV